MANRWKKIHDSYLLDRIMLFHCGGFTFWQMASIFMYYDYYLKEMFDEYVNGQMALSLERQDWPSVDYALRSDYFWIVKPEHILKDKKYTLHHWAKECWNFESQGLTPYEIARKVHIHLYLVRFILNGFSEEEKISGPFFEDKPFIYEDIKELEKKDGLCIRCGAEKESARGFHCNKCVKEISLIYKSDAEVNVIRDILRASSRRKRGPRWQWR